MAYNDVRDVIKGSPDSVQVEVKKYFDRYSPYGYGTKIVSDTIEADGTRVVVIIRDSSCG